MESHFSHTAKRQGKSDFNSEGLSRCDQGSQSATNTEDLHIAFCAPPGRDLVRGGGRGLARSHMTHKLKQNKGAHFEPGTGK